MMINVAIVNVRQLGQRLLVRADIMNAGFTEAFLVVSINIFMMMIIFTLV